MKPPICKLCKSPHWTYEEHHTTNSAINPDYIREMAAGAMGLEGVIAIVSPETATTIAENVTRGHEVLAKMCNTCNKPLHNRGKVCNACRQRAYRERSK